MLIAVSQFLICLGVFFGGGDPKAMWMTMMQQLCPIEGWGGEREMQLNKFLPEEDSNRIQ